MLDVTILFDFLKARPDLFVTAFVLGMWWLERGERKEQAKVNHDLQEKFVAALNEMQKGVDQTNMLLQLAIRERKD